MNAKCVQKARVLYRRFHRLLLKWPAIPVEYAIQLLDYDCPDERVHEFAVHCLRCFVFYYATTTFLVVTK